MEAFLPGFFVGLCVLLALALFAPFAVVLLALAVPVAAVLVLARLIHPRPRHAQPAMAGATAATLEGASSAGAVGLGGVSDRIRREAPSPRYRPRPQSSPPPRLPRAAPQLQAVASDALFAFDRDLNIVSWNKSAAKLTGIPVEEALGQPCWEVLGGVDANGDPVCHADCPGARLANLGSPVKGQPLLIKTATGARRPVWLSTIAVRGGADSLTLHLLRNGSELAKGAGQPEGENAAPLTEAAASAS